MEVWWIINFSSFPLRAADSMTYQHCNEKPFGAERNEGRGQETEGEEGRVAVAGKEIFHEFKVTEKGVVVKGFGEKREMFFMVNEV